MKSLCISPCIGIIQKITRIREKTTYGYKRYRFHPQNKHH